LKKLTDAGAVIDMIEIPEINDIMSLTGILYPTEAYGLWRDVIEANPHLMYEEIMKRFRIGAEVSGADYVAAWARLEAVRAQYDAVTAGYDAVLCPSAPSLPPNLDRLLQDEEYYVTENLLALRNTRIGNLLGLCALTLPTGTPSCGLMIMGKPDCEEALLRVGAAAEQALA